MNMGKLIFDVVTVSITTILLHGLLGVDLGLSFVMATMESQILDLYSKQ